MKTRFFKIPYNHLCHLSLTWQIFLFLGSVCLLQSCEIENLMDSLTGGTEEDYVIVNKNKGTLQVEEAYRDVAACYDVGENPYGIESIDFMANGTYHVTFSEMAVSKENFSRSLSIEFDGHHVRVPVNFATKNYEQGKKSTGTYTYKDGCYVVEDNYDWQMTNGQLIIMEDNQLYTYPVTKIPYDENIKDALSQRLCHSWRLSRVFAKFYNVNNGKLVYTCHLSDEDIRECCIETFVFSPSKKFFGYKDGVVTGVGNWEWSNYSEQTVTAWLRDPIDENESATWLSTPVYFSDNRMYLTQYCEDLDEEEEYEDEEDESIRVKAVLIYQLDVVGSN